MARLTKQQIADQQAVEVKVAQQAELARLRKEKRAAKKQVAAHVEAAQPDALHADISTLFDGLEFPSAKRVLVGLVLGIASAGVVGYGIGIVLAYALAGIATLTAAAWLVFAMNVIAWGLAIYASWKLGGYIGGKVFSSVVLPEGLASRSYESVANAASNAKAGMLGWFDKTKAATVEQFNGAHTIVKQAIAS